MKIFITGATGYLGQKIVQHAVEQGHHVRALCRTIPDIQQQNVEYIQGDILDRKSYKEEMEGCDALIHSAGLVSIWQRDPEDFRRVNLEGTRYVLETASRVGIDRMVYTSSFFALGPTDEKPANEEWIGHPRQGYKPTPYALSKYETDRWVRSWAQEGHGVVTVYPALIYGPGKETQGNHITKMIEDYVKRKLPGIPGTGTKRWTFSYIDDVAKGHLLALEKGKVGHRYILGGEDASLLEFFEILQSVSHIKPPRLKVPYSMLRVIGNLEVMRARMSRRYIPKVTPDVVDVYKQNWRYSSHKAITELGYTRTPLKIGIIKTLEDFGFDFPNERDSAL